MPFRYKCKGLFLTYPRCDVAPQVCVDNLLAKYGDNLEFACVAREHHADGGLHIHVVAELKKECDYHTPACMDFVTGQHGNYQPWKFPGEKGKKAALKYITKEAYVDLAQYNMDAAVVLDAMQAKQSGKYAMIANKIKKEEWSPDDLMEEHPEMYMMHGKKMDEFFERCRKKARVVENKEVILIYGESGIGKTQWVDDHEVDLYSPPLKSGTSNWWDGYTGQKAVLLDEFHGKMGLDDLLMILHKFVQRMPAKHGHITLDCQKIYLTSTSHPYSWYKWEGRVDRRAALKRRITKIMTIGENYSLVPLSPQFWDEFVFV